jgi:PAS domain-containing protein
LNIEKFFKSSICKYFRLNEELQQKVTKLEKKALRQSEERYRAIVENRTEMICCFLPDGTLSIFMVYVSIKN